MLQKTIQAVARIADRILPHSRLSSIGVTSLNFQGHMTSSVTWPFDSHRPFPIGGPLEPSLYL